MEGGEDYLTGDPLVHQFPQPQLQDGGSWPADDELLELIHGDDYHDRFFEEDQLGLYPYLMLDDDPFGTNNQLAADSSGVNLVQVDADADSEGMGYVMQAMFAAAAAASLEQSPAMGDYQTPPASLEQSPVVGAYQTPPESLEQSPAMGAYQTPPESLEQSPAVGADQPPVSPADATIQLQGFDSLGIAPDMLTATGPDHKMEEMVRVAAQCGEDDAPTVWSEEEHKELLRRLDQHAGDDAAIRCFWIAYHLPKKTALDVALRCRWLQDKSKTVAKAELAQQDSDCGKLNKVKGTKVARFSNKIYPLSEEALNSKSTKELIRDNIVFLKRIEEHLRTGQLANTADYFYYVKTNMDAIDKRGSEFGINMAMPPIDEQGLEEILRARLNSSA